MQLPIEQPTGGGKVACQGVWLPRLSALAIPGSLALVALLARLSVGPLTVDDAYITFRYARNLADGLGLAYNVGERVLGTTTPLFCLLLAGLYRLSRVGLPHLAVATSAAIDAATTVLLFWLGRRLGLARGWTSLLAGLFSLNALSIGFAACGMESSLFTFLVVAAVSAEAAGRPGLAGLAAGLAICTRPEGLIVGVLLVVRYLLVRRSLPWAMLLGFASPVLPWVVFATVWFGSPIPQSVAAKAVHYRQGPLLNTLLLIANVGQPGFNQLAFDLPDAANRIAVGFAVGVGILFVGLAAVPSLVRFLRGKIELLPLVGFAPLLAGAYAVAGARNVHLFPWYLVPLVPFYLLAQVGIVQRVSHCLPRPVALCLGLGLACWMVSGLSLGREQGRSPLAPYGMTLVRERAFITAAEHLAPRLQPDTVVALPEIGAFGYVSGARILDTAGLVSPQALRFYPLPKGYAGDICVPPELIREEQPDFVVGLDQFIPKQLLQAAWFQEDYRLLETLDAPIWGGKQVLVYEHRAHGD